MPVPTFTAALETIRRAQAAPTSSSSERVAEAVEEIVASTSGTYTKESAAYAELRGYQTSSRDEYMTETLLRTVREAIAHGRISRPKDDRWRLLDIGTGHGRDLVRFSREPDVVPVGIENASGFIDLLKRLEKEHRVPPGSVVAADMRDLSMFGDATFECVRNHATLHHLPVVSPMVGADVAVREARRVLVPGGIFEVFVKAGEGVEAIDTQEGIGQRFFQLFTPELLRSLLGRHRFVVEHFEERTSERPSGTVEWLFCLASAGDREMSAPL